jgi:hypothetical protein
MTDWQKIETCPKDHWVLVYEPGCHLMVAKWIYADQWQYAQVDAPKFYLSCRPTHWMMLPICPADWEGGHD